MSAGPYEAYLLKRFEERLSDCPLLNHVDTEDNPVHAKHMAALIAGLYTEVESLLRRPAV